MPKFGSWFGPEKGGVLVNWISLPFADKQPRFLCMCHKKDKRRQHYYICSQPVRQYVPCRK